MSKECKEHKTPAFPPGVMFAVPAPPKLKPCFFCGRMPEMKFSDVLDLTEQDKMCLYCKCGMNTFQLDPDQIPEDSSIEKELVNGWNQCQKGLARCWGDE